MSWKVKKEDYENDNYENHNSKYRKIADNDIVVYKFGFVGNTGNFYPYYIKDFSYKPNECNEEIELSLSEKYKPRNDDPTELIIIKGYHSLSKYCLCNIEFNPAHCFNGEMIKISLFRDKTWPYNKIDVVNYPNNTAEKRLVIGKFIIPANTEYYDDGEKEFVSSNIIWTGESYLVCYLKTNNRLTTLNTLVTKEKIKKIEWNKRQVNLDTCMNILYK